MNDEPGAASQRTPGRRLFSGISKAPASWSKSALHRSIAASAGVTRRPLRGGHLP
jgi:hypothetical protein